MKVMKVHAWKWRPTPYLVLLSFFLFWMQKSTNSAFFYSCLTKSPLSFLLLIRSWRDGVKLNLPYSQSLKSPRILSLPQPGLFFFTSSYLWLPEMNVNGTHSGWACQGLKFLWRKFFPSQHLMEGGGEKCPLAMFSNGSALCGKRLQYQQALNLVTARTYLLRYLYIYLNFFYKLENFHTQKNYLSNSCLFVFSNIMSKLK